MTTFSPLGDGAARLPRTIEAIDRGIAAGLHRGAQIYVSHWGVAVADLATGTSAPGTALHREDLMLWLSSTKPVTAVALARLWEEQALDLDDPVARFIPEFAQHGKDSITLRHLLTHTGGIRLLDVGWPSQSWGQIIERIAAMRPEPRWRPGHKAGYHTASSWFVLGEVVSRLRDRSFAELVREEVLLPLGMSNSWIGMPKDTYLGYRAAGRYAGLWRTESTPWSEEGGGEAWAVGCHPGGNGRGPMRELGRFYEMLLARGQLASGQRLLLPQTVEALTSPHRVGMLDQTFQHVLDWGLGFIINSSRYGAETVPYGYGHRASPRTFGHSGYRSSVAFADPEAGLIVALAFNGAPSQAAHEERVRSVLDGIYDDLGLGWEAESPAAPA
jgi:CubicO group peptidase (beta-lactamase class C family)